MVVESAESLHFVVSPLPVVETSILIVELAFSVAQPVQFVPLISAPNFKMFLDVLRLNLNRTGIDNLWSFGELWVKEVDLGFIAGFLLLRRRVSLVGLIVNGEGGFDMLVKSYRRRSIVGDRTFGRK